MAEARARFRAGEHDRADAFACPLCTGPRRCADEALDQYLSARGLLAQSGSPATVRTPRWRCSRWARSGRDRPERPLLEAIRGRILLARRPPPGGRSGDGSGAGRGASLSTADRARLSNNAGLCHYAAGDVGGR